VSKNGYGNYTIDPLQLPLSFFHCLQMVYLDKIQKQLIQGTGPAALNKRKDYFLFS